MDSGPGRLARITYHTGTRTFERLFKEKSLAETKEAIRRKLELSDDTDIRLKQLRGSITLDLEDDDDFDALRALAYNVPVIEVEVAVIPPTPSATVKKRKVSFGQAGEPAAKKLKPIIPPSTPPASETALPQESATSIPERNATKIPKKTKKVKAGQAEANSKASSPLPDNATEPLPPTEKRAKKHKKAELSPSQPQPPPETIETPEDNQTPAPEKVESATVEDGAKPKKRLKVKKKFKDAAEPSSEPATKSKRKGTGEQTNPRTEKRADESESSKFPAVSEASELENAPKKKRRRSEVGNDAAETSEAPNKSKARKRTTDIVDSDDVPGELAPTQPTLVPSPRAEAEADTIASRIAESLVLLVSSRDNEKGPTASAHSKPRRASRRAGPEDITSGEVSRGASQSASANPAGRSESSPASPPPALKTPKKRKKKTIPAQEPQCPICLSQPLHSSAACSVVTAGADSIQNRLAELTADSSRDHAALVKDLEAHLETITSVTKKVPVQPRDPIAIPPRTVMTLRDASIVSSPWTPSIPQGARIQEVPVQGQGEGSSSESSDEEPEPADEPPQPSSQSLARSSLLGLDADLESIMRGPLPQRSALQDIPSKSPSPIKSDYEDETSSEPEDDDDDDGVKVNRAFGRGHSVAASSDEEQDEEDGSLNVGRVPSGIPSVVSAAKQVTNQRKECPQAVEESSKSDTSGSADNRIGGSRLGDSGEDTAVERSSAADVEIILNTSTTTPTKEYSPDADAKRTAVDQDCQDDEDTGGENAVDEDADDEDVGGEDAVHEDADDQDVGGEDAVDESAVDGDVVDEGAVDEVAVDEVANEEPKEQGKFSSPCEEVNAPHVALAALARAHLREGQSTPEKLVEEAQDDTEKTPVPPREGAPGEAEGAQAEEEEDEASGEKAADDQEHDSIETDGHGGVSASQSDPIEDVPPTQSKLAPSSQVSIPPSSSRLSQRLKTRDGKIPDENYEYPVLASQPLPLDFATPKAPPNARMTRSQGAAKHPTASPRRTRASSRSQVASSQGAKSLSPAATPKTTQSSQPQSLAKWETMAEAEPSSPSVHHDELRSSPETRPSTQEGRSNPLFMLSQNPVYPYSQVNGMSAQEQEQAIGSDEAEGSKASTVPPVKLRPKPPKGPYRRLSELAREAPSFAGLYSSTPPMTTSKLNQSTLRKTAWEEDDDSSSDDDSDNSDANTSYIPASKKAGANLKAKAKRGRGLKSFA